MKNQKGVSSVVGTVLMLILSIAVAGVIYLQVLPVRLPIYSSVRAEIIAGTTTDGKNIILGHFGGEELSVDVYADDTVIFDKMDFIIGDEIRINNSPSGTYVVMVAENQVIFEYKFPGYSAEPIEGNYTGEHWDTTLCGSDNPIGVATEGTHLWLLDSTDDEVYKHFMNGTYTGEHWDTVSYPTGICIYGDYIWVANWGNTQVSKYTMDGIQIDWWLGMHVCDMTTDGVYFYATNNSDGVDKYDMDWTYIRSYNLSAYFTIGMGICNDGESIWITDVGTSIVHKFNMALEYQGMWELDATDDGRFVRGIAVHNYFYTADWWDDEIYVYYK